VNVGGLVNMGFGRCGSRIAAMTDGVQIEHLMLGQIHP
jgi:hypothetical protein